MLPITISGTHQQNAGTPQRQPSGVSNHTKVADTRTIQSVTNASQGRCVSGQMYWAKAGE